MKPLNIGNREISQESEAFIIAEMSGNHLGSLSRALEIVHAAKESGADCIKTQTYTPDTLTLDCRSPLFMVQDDLWHGMNSYDLYKQAYTPWDWMEKIKDEAESLGLAFLSSPFDSTAIDFLEDLGVLFYKIASNEITDIPLLKYVAATGKPVLMSTGKAYKEDIAEAVETLRGAGCEQIGVLKCSSMYPSVPECMNLKTITAIREDFNVIVGLSDHSLESTSSVIAVAMGAKIIEKHLCLDRKVKTPDSEFSLEPKEFSELVKSIRETEKIIGKEPYTLIKEEEDLRSGRRSLFASADIKKGDKFTKNNFRSIRPGFGLHTRYYDDVMGAHAACDIKFGTPLDWDMVEK